MTAHHDHDASTDDFADIEGMEALEDPDTPAGRVATAASETLASGTLPLLGGGLLLAAAIRAIAADRPQAILLGAAGSGLVGFGLHRRRSSDEGATESGVPDVEGGTDGKETSDQASAAANRVDSGRESEIESDGDISAEPVIDETDDSGSQIEYTEEPDEDASRSRPDLGADEEEPRRQTEADGTEIDVSDSAMADEVSEATGPSPEQAQPTQTADTEPEESPAEDASEMKVEPPEEDESEPKTDEGDDTEADETDEQRQ